MRNRILALSLPALLLTMFGAHSYAAPGGNSGKHDRSTQGRSADVRQDGAHRKDAEAHARAETRKAESKEGEPHGKGNETSSANRTERDETQRTSPDKGGRKDKDRDQDLPEAD